MVTEIALENFYKDKKVLITGHTGFKGSWMVMLLNFFGAEVYGYSLEPPTALNLFEFAKVKELMKLSIIGDVREYDKLFEFVEKVKPDIVFHMAAQPLVRESYLAPVETYSINVMGTVNLLEACRKTQGKKAIVNITTDKCYENKEWHWGYRENDVLNGFDPYSNSKSCSELVTSSYQKSYFSSKNNKNYEIGLASARAGNVIGGGDWANDRLVPDFFRAISKMEQIIVRNPKAIRPWQHVLEPLSGYLILASKLYDNPNELSGAWNFGPFDNEAKSVEWVVDFLCKHWGNNVTYDIDLSEHPHEAHYLKLDCTKANHILQWVPKWNIEKALHSIIDWNIAYLQNQNMQKICLKQIEHYLYTK